MASDPLKLLTAGVLACLALVAAPAGAGAADPVVYAAGDVACDPLSPAFNAGLGTDAACRQKATADVMVDGTFDAVIALGDLQYDSGSLTSFQQSYDLSWGRVKPLTLPAIGNHEGSTATGGSGFCSYFGAAAHCNASKRQGGAVFYSRDIGTWHVIVLNSNCLAAGGCDVGSPQYQWLADDLATHRNACTLAAWHHPRWSTGHDGSNLFMQPIWKLLYDNQADLVLAGHSHDYERFAPIDGDGFINNADGMRSFVVGTGGNSFTGIGGPRATGSEIVQNTTYGVLRLVLRPKSYDWTFVPEAGKTFTDLGTQRCRGIPDTQAPTAPTGIRAVAASASRVDVSWKASTDDVGVTGYEIWRADPGGTLASLATAPGTATTYADTTVAESQAYTYAVTARDGAGNVSARSAAVAVTTPAAPPPPPPPPPPAPDAAPPPAPPAAPTIDLAPVLAPETPAPEAPAPPPAAATPPARTLAAPRSAPPHERLRLRAATARRSLRRGWVYVAARPWRRALIEIRVGGRLAARRLATTTTPEKVRLAAWVARPGNRRLTVTVTIRALT